MKMKLLFSILILSVVLPLDAAYACTSFAVYSKQVYYGMNFDFINLPIKFLISINGNIRTFHLAFQRVMGDMKFFVNTAGMNSNGLFSSCQELHPVNTHPSEKTDTTLFTFELYDAISSSRSAEEIKRIGQQFPVIDMPGITLHNLVADTSGQAFTAEAGERETVFTDKQGGFIVMTNFSNRTMVGKRYREAQGTGSDRYIICHEFLQKHTSDFTVDKGFQLLSMSCNKDPHYPTRCSLVFDPQKRDIYIVLERHFSKILKLSLGKGTIEPFKGYEKNFLLRLSKGGEGILAEDLKQRIPQHLTDG